MKKSSNKKPTTTPNTEKKSFSSLKLILAGLLLLNVAGLLWITSFVVYQNNELEKSNEFYSNILENADKIKGYTCGAFSESMAREVFEFEELNMQFLNQPVQINAGNELVFMYVDGCYYEVKNNSDKFARYFISTFETEEEAKKRFDGQLPPVNDAKEVTEVIDAERMVYDAGVYYILRDRRVIEIGGSNGNPAENETFAKELVYRLEPSL